jgi:hypothetical protein
MKYRVNIGRMIIYSGQDHTHIKSLETSQHLHNINATHVFISLRTSLLGIMSVGRALEKPKILRLDMHPYQIL